MHAKRLLVAIVLGVVIVPLVACAVPQVASAPSQSVALAQTPAPSKGITVVGTGRVTAKPDMASINLGVQTQGETAQQAQQVNAQKMEAVVRTLKGMGIAENDIQTSTVSLQPVYEQDRMSPSQSRIVAYEARNIVFVRLMELTKVGAVLDEAVKSGANAAYGIQFGLRDDAEQRKEALKMAVQDAQAKADAIAEAMGHSAKDAESVIEESVSFPLMAKDSIEMTRAAAAAPTPIEPGELEITANVRVVYGF